MGACCTTPAPVAPNADDGDPPNQNGVPPFTTAASGGKGSKGSKPTSAPTRDNQGRHWAENDANKKRTAKAPWQMNADDSAPKPSDDACEPCNDQNFEFTQTFPMFVMKMETFLELKIMRSHEDMLAEGKVFEWTPSMGRVWFMSHQWTSFSHPDPASEQLTVAQKLIKTIMDGKARSIFATEEEWQGYITREANRFLNFPVLTAEQLAEDAAKGYVWLDYASVPQAIEAEEQRANAIDSIPYYVDNALAFLALVPRVEHKDLPGVFCDYKSWQSRGWCRLETQVHELRPYPNPDPNLNAYPNASPDANPNANRGPAYPGARAAPLRPSRGRDHAGCGQDRRASPATDRALGGLRVDLRPLRQLLHELAAQELRLHRRVRVLPPRAQADRGHAARGQQGGRQG